LRREGEYRAEGRRRKVALSSHYAYKQMYGQPEFCNVEL